MTVGHKYSLRNPEMSHFQIDWELHSGEDFRHTRLPRGSWNSQTRLNPTGYPGKTIEAAPLRLSPGLDLCATAVTAGR